MKEIESKSEIDVLGREEFLQTILRTIEYYSTSNQNISFSIQGEWGCGKSWILDRVFENLYDMQDENIAGGRYCVFKYNAWKYDYYDEPLVSLLISLKEQFDSENSIFFKSSKSQENYKAVKLMIKEKILDCVDVIQESPLFEIIDSKMFHIPKLLCTGATIKKEFEKYKEEIKNEIRNYDPHYDLNELMNSLVSGLNKISQDEKKTIVVIVDELDRCLPEHAIKVLERMHHISQNVDNIQFVYGIDKTQIEKNIVQIFNIGEVPDKDNRIKKYLSKFVTFGLKVPESKYQGEIEKKYSQLFAPFDKVNTYPFDIIEKIKLILIPEINARTVELIVKKIILTNSIINKAEEKLDDSILVFELFYAISREMNYDWVNNHISNDLNRNSLKVGRLSTNGKIIDIFNNFLIPNIVGSYRGTSESSAIAMLKTDFIDSKEVALFESAMAYYYAGKMVENRVAFDCSKLKEAMDINLRVIKDFCNYYDSLVM